MPIYAEEILPGDTANIDVRGIVRMSTPIWPVMGNAYIDIYFFWCPNRILWEHWRELMGENRQSYWAQTVEYSTPQTTAPTDTWTVPDPSDTSKTISQGGWKDGTIADYMGIPSGVPNISVSSLYFRAYSYIWNEFFRDENLQQPVTMSIQDATTAGANETEDQTQAEKGGYPLKVARYHDYFSSCLPEPQKGEPASIPITGAAQVWTSIVSGYSTTGNTVTESNLGYTSNRWTPYVASTQGGTQYWAPTTGTVGTIGEVPNGITPKSSTNNSATWADLGTGVNVTVNELRQAIAVQHILELDARGGSRYRELLQSHWGVTVPDSRMQIPEYLGGFRQPIQVFQVVQNSSTDSTSPQGNTGAYSKTGFNRSGFTKSFDEHGILLGLACVRVEHSYQQGLDRKFTRKTRFDYYDPMLANLGEQAVLNREIYATGEDADEEVFGYQEAWADYRYCISRVSGEMRSNAINGSLDSWLYTDWYDEQPTLSSTWIQEGKENIDRTLAVTSSLTHQFICDFYFDQTWTRELPIYSVPGLERI